MIVLLPKIRDTSSEIVMDWIHHCGYPCQIFYFNDIVNFSKTNLFDTPGGPMVFFVRNQYDWLIEKTEISNANFSLFFERRELLNFFFEKINSEEGCHVINFTNNYNGNKLIQLNLASKVGMKIPRTAIITDKTALSEMFDQGQEVVTKSLHKGLVMKDKQRIILNYTSVILAHKTPETFFPSLVQERIDKAYEIRTFYLQGKCYSAAILSQVSEETEVDFRKYNSSRPNRIIPYQLPEIVEQQIDELMQALNLSSGSIDLIKSRDGDFVFLEVNPHGHFGFVSSHCNYYLEKEIANHLIYEYQNHS